MCARLHPSRCHVQVCVCGRALTSVTASREAECLSSRSRDLVWFFLQAM